MECVVVRWERVRRRAEASVLAGVCQLLILLEFHLKDGSTLDVILLQ